ncbi:hypothetical protein E2542_SST21288 [Spatholobus suberectus]|nr:hypothetical protein E2542_SST21288 [Spatholobus suberectus]
MVAPPLEIVSGDGVRWSAAARKLLLAASSCFWGAKIAEAGYADRAGGTNMADAGFWAACW